MQTKTWNKNAGPSQDAIDRAEQAEAEMARRRSSLDPETIREKNEQQNRALLSRQTGPKNDPETAARLEQERRSRVERSWSRPGLATERAYFGRISAGLLQDGYAGQYALIRGEELIGIFSTPGEADHVGTARFTKGQFGRETFLVELIR